MRKNIIGTLLILLTPLFLGCDMSTNTSDVDQQASAKDSMLSILKETRTTQYFSDEPVTLEDMTEILDAGRNATSGRNMQSWHFGAIINQDVIREIASTMIPAGPPPGASTPQAEGAPMLPPTSSAFPKAGFADAPAAIALACAPGQSFSAGLACENMVIAATALGYGAKIVMSGADQLNSPENRTLLQIPEEMSVIAILLVGKPDDEMDMTADGVTGASERKPMAEVSTIVE